MIKNHEVLKNFEDEFIKDKGKLSYEQALEIFTQMWLEGKALGALPPADQLEGIEVDIRIAEVLNSCLKRYSQR